MCWIFWRNKKRITGETDENIETVFNHIADFALGEILSWLLPFPVPASVYGLVLMMAALMTGAILIPQVKEAAVILIELMPVMFIPAAVGLMTVWEKLRPMVVPVIVITFVTTLLVMGATGLVTQKVIEKTEKGSEN